VGTHRRISAAPSNPCAANADGRAGRAGREGWVGLDSPIDRPTDPSPRAVKGARRQFPLRSSGLRGVAARVGGFCSIAAPIFLRAGRNGQRASRGLYIGDSHGVAEPRHAPSPLTPLSRLAAPHTGEGATLGEGGIPMSQIAPAVGTSPARRLRRPAAGSCGSIRFMPGTLPRACDGTRDREPKAFALARPTPSYRVPGFLAPRARVSAFSANRRGRARNNQRKAPQ
jgi:hypothetical protein